MASTLVQGSLHGVERAHFLRGECALFLVLYFVLLFVSAAFDARLRICPNWLSISLAVCAIVFVSFDCGGNIFCRRLLAALLLCLLLLLVELFWRHFFGQTGLGIGDIKVLFSLVLVQPLVAVVALCVSLLSLALFCLLFRRHNAPLLPFLFLSYAVSYLVFVAYTSAF